MHKSSINACCEASLPIKAGPNTSLTALTALRTPLPLYLDPPSRNSTAS